MFTGIVEAVGVVGSSQQTRGGLRLSLKAPFKVKPGSSIAVNGVCLTAVDGLAFDVVPETLSRTNLGKLKPGSRVNLERAMKSSARLDGHIVQGHVEGVGVVESFKRGKLAVRLAPHLTAALVPKGSITVDGVSLTVVDAEPERFTVALIPFTLKHTTLGDVKKGDVVNIETDVLKRKPVSKITKAFLVKAGFA